MEHNHDFVVCTVALLEWLRHTASVELLFKTLVQLPHLLLVTLISGNQLYFSKREFCTFLHQFAPNMCKSGTAQTGCSLLQKSTCSCLYTCLWLLSHNSQALTSTIQNSRMKRNFGVLEISRHYWQKSNKYLYFANPNANQILSEFI